MWANKNTSLVTHDNRHGFTIVELLIVIVVIGILAAITIVAYNGIQTRARTATITADLVNAAKKMALDNVNNGSYALTAAAVDGGNGLPTSSGTTYQYHSTGTTYCVTGTNGNVSYKISDTATTPSAGGCAGDSQGGVAAITNLITNPSFEGGSTGWGTYGSTTNYSVSNTQASNGTSSMLLTEPSDGGYHGYQIGFAASAGNAYTTSAAIYRVSGASNIVMRIEWYTAASAFISYNQINVTPSNSPIGSWARQAVTATAPATTGKALFVFAYQGAVSGESFYGDAIMTTISASQYNYADGNSSNWIWNGTTNNSTSTGPPQ
jgi:prepilin-type N-terminal cleavage/methylation domain-containing protein